MRVCALVGDLMDRSQISAAVPDAAFVRDAAACADADVVIVDLARSGDQVARYAPRAGRAHRVLRSARRRRRAPRQPRAAGADVVLPRSKFFRDVAAAIGS